LRVPAAICLVLLVSATGCMPSRKLPAGALDEYWYLHADTWPQARRESLQLAGRTLPTRWVFRQEPSLIWSTVSMVRAIDALKVGTDDFEMAVSPTHAEMLARVLAQFRGTLEGLRDIAEPDEPRSPRRWASAVAGALVSTEEVVRLAVERERPGARKGRDEALGWSAGPVIHMLAAYLDERTGGDLLAGMGGEEVGRLREVLTQVILRLGFAAAGKRDPPGLRTSVAAALREAKDPGSARRKLLTMLTEHLASAPPAGPDRRLPALLGPVFAVAPRMLEVLEGFARQWDRMDSLAVELRRHRGRPVVSLTVKVQPGKQLRLTRLHFLQPDVVFRGGTRITVQTTDLGETVVLFEPLRDGKVEIRFDGIVYGLVRLLALPLASGALREVRVSAAPGPTGRLTNVAVLMEAGGDRTDPRRILAFQDVRCGRIVREPFRVRRMTERTEQIFNYLTPRRRYTYRRVKVAGE